MRTTLHGIGSNYVYYNCLGLNVCITAHFLLFTGHPWQDHFYTIECVLNLTKTASEVPGVPNGCYMIML